MISQKIFRFFPIIQPISGRKNAELYALRPFPYPFYLSYDNLLIAEISAWTEAVIISSSMPAPQAVFPV